MMFVQRRPIAIHSLLDDDGTTLLLSAYIYEFQRDTKSATPDTQSFILRYTSIEHKLRTYCAQRVCASNDRVPGGGERGGGRDWVGYLTGAHFDSEDLLAATILMRHKTHFDLIVCKCLVCFVCASSIECVFDIPYATSSFVILKLKYICSRDRTSIYVFVLYYIR